MRIIDEKVIEYITVCPKCKTKMAYTKDDVWSYCLANRSRHHIIYCPYCNKQINCDNQFKKPMTQERVKFILKKD